MEGNVRTESATLARVDVQRQWSMRRLRAVTRAELIMLFRSKVSLFYSLAVTPLIVVLLSVMPSARALSATMPRGGFATILIAALVGMSLCTSIYFNLTTAFVARRESLMLKRLHSGEAGPGDLLVAIAAPHILVFVLQAIILTAATLAFGPPPFTNPVVLGSGIVLGTLFFTLASYVTAALTNTVESAQLTTVPGMLGGMFLSGLVIPVTALPDTLANVMMALPMAPVVDLVMLGLNGSTLAGHALEGDATWAAAARPVLTMLIWCGAATILLRSKLRWEPRR